MVIWIVKMHVHVSQCKYHNITCNTKSSVKITFKGAFIPMLTETEVNNCYVI